MKLIKLKYLLLIVLLTGRFFSHGQDDLLSLLEETDADAGKAQVLSTWKGVRLINGHTTRMMNPGIMNFVISHRFGRINNWIDEFYGLDDSQIRLALEFGLTNNLNAGIGRSSNEKVVDGYLKYRILSQRENNSIPVTVTAFSSVAVKTYKEFFPDQDASFSQRLIYSYQLLIARKFGNNLSMQVSPSLIHRNVVQNPREENDIYAVGVGGRYKISNRSSINAEWYPQFNNSGDYTNALSFGIDVETGGHVFQLHVTNSRAMIESGFIAETNGDWSAGDLHFGFNISRAFNLKAGKRTKKDLDLEKSNW